MSSPNRLAWTAAACLCFCLTLCAQTPLTPSALEGAWKLRSLSMDGKKTSATGYMLFHGNYYSFITNMERPKLTAEISRKPGRELTEAEKDMHIETFRSMTASAGSYSIEGDQIVYHQEVTRLPHLVGSREGRKSWFEGDRLLQDFVGGGRRRVMEWERVSGGSAPKK